MLRPLPLADMAPLPAGPSRPSSCPASRCRWTIRRIGPTPTGWMSTLRPRPTTRPPRPTPIPRKKRRGRPLRPRRHLVPTRSRASTGPSKRPSTRVGPAPPREPPGLLLRPPCQLPDLPRDRGSLPLLLEELATPRPPPMKIHSLVHPPSMPRSILRSELPVSPPPRSRQDQRCPHEHHLRHRLRR